MCHDNNILFILLKILNFCCVCTVDPSTFSFLPFISVKGWGAYFKVKINTFKFQILYLKRDNARLFAFPTNVKALE